MILAPPVNGVIDCRDIGTNVIIDHTQFYHADDNWLVVLQLEMLLSDNSFSRSHTTSLLAKMRSTAVLFLEYV